MVMKRLELCSGTRLSPSVSPGLTPLAPASAGRCIMKTSQSRHNTENVVDLFTGKSLSELHDQRFVRLAPELDGLEMLYSNDTSDDRLFSLKILCWGLRANGEVVALVPWLNDIVACP